MSHLIRTILLSDEEKVLLDDMLDLMAEHIYDYGDGESRDLFNSLARKLDRNNPRIMVEKTKNEEDYP